MEIWQMKHTCEVLDNIREEGIYFEVLTLVL